MKILYIEPCHVGFGGYFRAFNMAHALTQENSNIHIDLLVSSASSLKISKRLINPRLAQYELPRYNIHFFFNGRLLRALIGVLFGLFKKYDLIHVFVPVQLESNIPGYILKKLGKKVVMDWDDYWEGSDIYKNIPIMKKYVAFCENMAPNFFEYYVTASDFLGNLAKDRGAKKVLKVINGVNKTQFALEDKERAFVELGLSSDNIYVISMGHTFMKERALEFLSFVDEVALRNSKVYFITNMDTDTLIMEAQRVNVNYFPRYLKNILSVGYIKQDRIGKFFSLCDFSLFLAGDFDNERACFPIRIGTYLLGETIILMNNINSEANYIVHTHDVGLIGKDFKDLSIQFLELLSDESLKNQKITNVKIAKEDLSWSKLGYELLAYYKEILND